jgi:hypothetical protein
VLSRADDVTEAAMGETMMGDTAAVATVVCDVVRDEESEDDVVRLGDVKLVSWFSFSASLVSEGGGVLVWTFMCFLRELGCV